ncbi:hypothetical protein BKA64DRAFT_701531 [Cadophora sp. MPI-SDFR-AT-0126]|nr:hypothetical protein BKA64DRAFT_701531 [Leotiomycetes sp. MPI-SDFR-AT-0126]
MSTTASSTSASATLDGSDDPWTLAKARFLSDLDPSERDIFNNATLENLFYTTSNTNRDDAEKSRVRSVATKLGPLVSAIENYGKALDTFAQIAPLYLSPIWGSIRVLLVLARSYGKFFERVVDTLGRIGDVLPRFRDYQRIYSRAKHQRLTQALSNAYLDIIVLCTQIRKSILEQKTSSFRRFLKPVALDRQFDEAVERFRQHKKNVDDEARVCHMIEAAEKREEELILYATERKRRLLSRLSTVAFEYKHQKLKALRYEGTGTWLIEDKKYEKWKSSAQSAVLCCHGIPGCGKSVLASSIVDYLIDSNTTIYYYCDYSDKRTLDPANLFGTLARQVLGKLESIPEALATAIEKTPHDGDRVTDGSCALDFLRRGIELCGDPIYIALDGIDELTEQSQKATCNGLKELINGCLVPIRLFLTGREDMSSLLVVPSTIPFTSISVIPSVITSDIRKFVQASTRRRIVEGTLVLQDPSLEELVVDELVSGAQGMFLWVEFQLCDLCEAESDYGIRVALENLPRSLSETYDRLLGRIEGTERRSMILRMFKWIVCARQPLHVDELREGVAFTLDDEEWRQEKIPTNLNRLIRACSNLIIVDAETNIVQLAHYTVQQYLLKNDGRFFQFGLKDANEMAGEFCLAYLTFSCFDTQVTRYGSNTNTDLVALQKMASGTAFVASDHPGRKFIQAWNTMRGPRTAPQNVNLLKLTKRSKLSADSMSTFCFLEYVVTHWLWHTVDFELSPHTSRRDRMSTDLVCWKDLLFEFRPWASFNKSTQRSSSIALFGWAMMANHGYLLRTAAIAVERSIPGQVVLDAWRDFIRGGHDRLVTFDSKVDSLMGLQKEHCRSKLASRNSLWLLSQLLFACQEGHLRVLEAFDLRGICEVALEDGIPLPQFLILLTAGTGQLQIIRYLTTHKSVREEDLCRMWEGPTPWRGSLERAFASRHFDTVLYLSCVGYGIDSICPNIDTYSRLLNNAITAGDCEIAEFLLSPRLILPFEISPQVLSDPFVLAIQEGLLIVVAAMLRLGVDPNNSDGMDQIPIIAAIRSRNFKTVALLLEYGCDLNLTRYGLPLTVAASMGDLAVCKMLIASGAEVFHGFYEDVHAAALVSLPPKRHLQTPSTRQDRPSNNRQPEMCLSPTPLYMACYYGYRDIVQMLLERGSAIDFPSPTHCFNATLVGPDTRAGITFHPYTLGKDGSHHWIQEDSRFRSKTMSEWKYPVTIATEQGHEHILTLLYAAAEGTIFERGSISVDKLRINPSHQWFIQKTILHNWVKDIPSTDPRHKQAVYTAACLNDLRVRTEGDGSCTDFEIHDYEVRENDTQSQVLP